MIPKISVMMPTRNRRQFIPQALKYYLWQDYPNKELIVVDDGEDKVADLMPERSDIRYISISEQLTIGTKRNIACSKASGDIISFQDDDDYYGPHRLSKQVAPILASSTNITGMVMSLLLRTADSSLWSLSTDVHDKLFGYGVRCGTLMYRSFCWRSSNCAYPNTSHGEDKAFLSQQYRDGERVERIIDPASYICVRHGDNVTANIDGIGTPGWEQVPLSEGVPDKRDRAFYRALAGEYIYGSR